MASRSDVREVIELKGSVQAQAVDQGPTPTDQDCSDKTLYVLELAQFVIGRIFFNVDYKFKTISDMGNDSVDNVNEPDVMWGHRL